jgi:hypothetical protein
LRKARVLVSGCVLPASAAGELEALQRQLDPGQDVRVDGPGRSRRPGDALAAFTESLSAAQPAPKQRAVIMLEVATAARQDGVARRDSDRIDESFRLACEALGVGVAYSSERIVDRARRFRREYAGPATSYVRDFDDQLRSALL